MDEQNPDQNLKQKTKAFGAPRMRATELLDVLREEGKDVTELSHELETTTYIDPEMDEDEQAPRKSRKKKNTYADLAPKPGVTGHHNAPAHGHRSGHTASSPGASTPRVGSFFTSSGPEIEDIPYPPDIPTPEEKSLGIGSSFYSTQQQIFDDNLTMPTPEESSVGVGNSFYSTEQQVFAPSHPAAAPKSVKHSAKNSETTSANTSAAAGANLGFNPESAEHPDLLAEAENVHFDPNSAMAKLLASTEQAGGDAGFDIDPAFGFDVPTRAAHSGHGRGVGQEPSGLGQPGSARPGSRTSSRPGRRNPSAGNPAYSSMQLGQEELEEYRFIKGDESLSDFAKSTSSLHSQVQSTINQMSNEMTSDLYDTPDEGVEQLGPRSTLSPFNSSSSNEVPSANGYGSNGYGANDYGANSYGAEVQVDEQGQVIPGTGYRGALSHSSGLGDNPTIQNNYIPDATPSPMPTFTPSAYTSPYADVTNNQAATHVVDGEIVPDDPGLTLREEYASFLANKQAARDLQAAEHSTSPIYHPWTLAKNRISKEELLRQKALEKAHAELSLNPMYRLQMEVRGETDNFGNLANAPGGNLAAGNDAAKTESLPPPPEAHLLAQDAALGLPVDNPLLLQSAKGSLIATIDFHGGMLSQLIYQRKSGQVLDLLYHAPWLKDNYYFRSPNLEQHMAGEWPCVPFGWCVTDAEANRAIVQHGFACQNHWNVEMVLTSQSEFLQYVDNPEAELVSDNSLESCLGSGVVMSYQYPEDMPLEKIVRSLYINDKDVLFNFTLYPRRDCKVPMAAYPLFAMHPDNDLVMLDIEGDGVVYPRQYEPGVSRFLQKSHFFSLDSIALRKEFVNKDGNGLSADATVLPFRYPTEEVVQMLNPKGRARLYYPNKQLHLVLKWEETKLPNCVVWISNGGRSYAPWGGESYCLGVAPMIGTWDMADEALHPNNLIEQHGQPTYVQLKAGQRFSFSYSLFVEDLKPDDDMTVDAPESGQS